MKKFLLSVWMLITAVLFLTGCGGNSVPKEEDIQKDLESFSDQPFLGDGETITNLSIDKRDTDKKNKSDLVWCTVATATEDVAYEKEVTLSYYLYDKAGWELEDYKVADSEQWTVTPLKGVDEENIRASLDGQTITVNNEAWQLSDSEFAMLTIQNQTTDLEKETDQVTLDIVLDGCVETVTGTLVADYTFDRTWQLKNMTAGDSLKAEMKSDKVLDVSVDRIIGDLENQEISYGVSGAVQRVVISKDQIEDFKVDSQEFKEKGTEQSIQCSGKLVKDHATFNISISAEYAYNSYWECRQSQAELTLDSVDLLGEWKGTYIKGGGDGTATLNITEFEDNHVKGIYAYTPYGSGPYNEPGSYEVEGEFISDGLMMTLKAGDWIEEPSKTMSVTKQNVNVLLRVDEDILKGGAQESSIVTLTKQ